MRWPLLLALMLVTPASAHITFTADGPSDPVAVGETFGIVATAKEVCPEALANENAMGITELTVKANASAGFFTATDATLPWDAADCETSGDDAGSLVSSGTVNVTIAPLTPAGKLPIQLAIDGTDTTTNADVVVQQYAVLAGTAPSAATKHEHQGNGSAMFGIDIPLTVQSNGALTLRFAIEGQGAPEDIDVANPLTSGSNETAVDVPVTVMVPDGEIGDYTLDIEAVNATGSVLATHAVAFSAINTESDHETDNGTEPEGEESPGLPLVTLLVGLAAVAARRRAL